MNDLLQPGFAGLLSYADAEHIRQKLEASESLRQKWGIQGVITLVKIAALALPEDAKHAQRHMRQEIAKERRRVKRQYALKRRNLHKIGG